MKTEAISKFVALTLLAILSISILPSFSIELDLTHNVHTVVITLGVDNWELFKEQLHKLKQIGVDAIATDVAWRFVETWEGSYDWANYKKYVEAVKEAGLLWIPEIAVQWVPLWVWQGYRDAKFINEFNETSDDYEGYMSYWHPQTKMLIQRFYSEFFAEFSDYNETIYGVYVSAGMWGELAYPIKPRYAYWGYDVNAKVDFKEKMSSRYGTIENANQQWGTSFNNWTQVDPPLPNTPYTNMWTDFLSWYNSTQIEYEDWILNTTRTYYNGPINIKIPMDSIREKDIKLGHIDYTAIFSTAAKYKAIPTYTFIENTEMSITYSNIAKNYNLDYWGENAGLGADLNTVLNDLVRGDYEVFCYFWIQDLFDTQGNPTSRFNTFKNFIKQWDPAPVADFECQPTGPSTGSTITFNASESLSINGVIVSYEWNFDDGNITTVATPIITHIYSQTGDYTVVLNVTDSLGLWNIFFRHLIVYEHDVSVTAVEPYRTIVDNASSTSINITVANQGDYFETFNVTLYVNTTIVQTITISLFKGRSTSISLSWNTTQTPSGNYNLKAVVSPVENETVLENNELVDGSIRISIKGDINGDGKVDMKDVSYVARRFMCLPSDSLWDSNGDVDEDNKIDMKDIAVVAKEFGKNG